MTDEVPDILLRVRHRGPVRWIIDAVVALAELVEALHIGGHVPVGREHHGRRPTHYMVAAEQGAAIGETQMIGRMPRRGDGNHRFAIHIALLAVVHHPVGCIVAVE